MEVVFYDSNYLAALLDPKDELHDRAEKASSALPSSIHIFTTEMILTEFLNLFSDRGMKIRTGATEVVHELRRDPSATVVPQTSTQFDNALSIYSKFQDKEWSLTDCASYAAMKENNIYEALTHDKHFEQMGFKALLRSGL